MNEQKNSLSSMEIFKEENFYDDFKITIFLFSIFQLRKSN